MTYAFQRRDAPGERDSIFSEERKEVLALFQGTIPSRKRGKRREIVDRLPVERRKAE
jgi:hypothetical protein